MHILIVVFLVVVGIQLIYLLAFLIAFGRKRKRGPVNEVPVSIVVCAHDEFDNLKELVPQLLSQDYPEFEVIVVNDRSNDHTFDYLLEATQQHPRLRMVNVKDTPERVNGKKYGITLGIKAAAHEWILLTDADCRPNGPNWIRSMSAHFDDDAKFVLGFSPYVRKSGFLNLFIRFETILTAIQYFAFGWMGNPYMGVGRNLAYRKSLFLEQKGFNNFLHVTGGDDDLFVNMHARGRNTRLEIAPESQVYSLPKDTWSSYWAQKVRHLSVGKRYRFWHRFLLGLFSLSWILTWLTWLILFAWLVTSFEVPASAQRLETYLIVAPFLLRWILLFLLIGSMLKKASVAFSRWALPLLDFIYAIYYLSTGFVALTTKKIRWRK
ncbi:MAG TPA: glycosyltransferase [Chryseosolibacter sp.]|nr:glycosyltransferase [Chryseosolibacter sp.]